MLNAIITTIQPPTECVTRLARTLAPLDARLVVAGDTKGPAEFDLSNVEGFDPARVEFLSIDVQLASGFSLAPLLPTKHYCRKNIAYLNAIRSGATCIYETDDDNAPLDSWRVRSEWIDGLRFVDAIEYQAPTWVNVYRHFCDELIWPRGLPLDRIHEPSSTTDVIPPRVRPAMGQPGEYWSPIQQGLANGAPDVDAVWRLVLDREFTFQDCTSVMLAPGQWCPFNTQTTWWWPAAYPLLYVPSHCSFRMCDIWKSFVAQRCLWELGTGVVFHAPEVVQERNVHQLSRDFEDEVPGYLHNHRLVAVLESTPLQSGPGAVGANLRSCYAVLVEHGFFPDDELTLVDAWLADVVSFTAPLGV
jgi:hypothetical protein